MAYRLYNRWLILALVLASILCAYLSPIDTAFAQLCPERWEASSQGLEDTYKLGENIDFTVNYLTRNPSDCPTCRQQIIVGMVDSSGKVIYVSCVYDGSPQTCPKETSGTGKISWKSPSDVGAYQILAANDYQNSCEDAKANFRVKSSNRLLATIQVSTSSPAASSTKPVGSDTTGSIQNPLSALQTWVQQIMNPSGTGTTQPATISTTSGSPTAGFSSWFQQNQKAFFSVLALIIIAVLGLRYLINRKRGDTDKVITVILGAASLGYLSIIWVIIPIIIFVIVNWLPILISLLVTGIIAIIAWKKGWITFRSKGDNDNPVGSPIATTNEGYIYIAHSPALKEDIFKVGMTRRKPEDRVEEFSQGTGVPARFLVQRKWKVSDCVACESQIHRALSSYRIYAGREFFQLSYDNLFRIVNETVIDYEQNDKL